MSKMGHHESEVGMFSKRKQNDDGDAGNPVQRPGRQRRQRGEPKLTNRSAISPGTLVAIQAAVSTADGFVTGGGIKKKDGQNVVQAYIQGLVTPPKRAQITVVAVRREENDTAVTVVITTSKGEKVTEIVSPNVLHAGNAAPTARTIANTLLGMPGATGICQRELTALVGESVGSVRNFSVGGGNRLQITKGEGQ